MEIYTLHVGFDYNGTPDALYPVILKSGSETLLIDCGYAGFLPLLEAAATLHGLSLASLTGVILTHHDIDHIGGLYELKQAYPQVKVYTFEEEEKYISGKAKSLRLQQAEDMYPHLPDAYKPGALQFQELLQAVKPVPVDKAFSAGDNLGIEGLEIIPTPGHMPGHFSIYLSTHKTLIAADALVIENEAFEIANPQFTLDLPQAVASVQKLAALNLNEVICYHGGSMRQDIKPKLKQLLAKYEPAKV